MYEIKDSVMRNSELVKKQLISMADLDTGRVHVVQSELAVLMDTTKEVVVSGMNRLKRTDQIRTVKVMGSEGAVYEIADLVKGLGKTYHINPVPQNKPKPATDMGMVMQAPVGTAPVVTGVKADALTEAKEVLKESDDFVISLVKEYLVTRRALEKLVKESK